MDNYNPLPIEKKWQLFFENKKIFSTKNKKVKKKKNCEIFRKTYKKTFFNIDKIEIYSII